MADDPVRADPPARYKPPEKGQLYEWLAPMMDHPGEWHRLPHDWALSAARHMRDSASGKSRTHVLPLGRWEFRSTTLGTDEVPPPPVGRAHVYVRYLGPEEAP